MSLPVNTVASGGLAVVDVSLIPALTKMGLPVSEAAPGMGVAVTKVTNLGLPVVFLTIGATYTTLDNATTTNVTLSNGNLTATHINTTTNSGARNATQKNSGKYYFEITCTTVVGGDALGIITAAGTYTNAVTNATNGAYLYITGTLWTGGASTGLTLGNINNGDVIGIAVDLDNDKTWFRKSPSGLWNGLAIGSQDPANNIGGVNISALSGTTVSPVIGYGITANDVMTANFGASAFSGAVPSGFTSGWPV